MSNEQLEPARQPAMPQQLVELKMSTATWLMVVAVLMNYPLPGRLEGMRRWAADQIIRELLVASNYAEDTED